MNKEIQQAVILAGGYGTRLKPFTDHNPKPMFKINDKPFLEYLINQTKSFGIKKIVMLLGYLPEVIMDYFGDGKKWGIEIKYSITPVEYETGARIKQAFLDGYLDDNFLLMYCDNYCPINFFKLLREFKSNNALIQLSVYENSDGYTKDNLRVSEDGMIITYDKSRNEKDLSGVDIGYALVNRSVVETFPDLNENFEKIIYPKLVETSQLYGTITKHRYYSIGSWDRINLTEKFFSNKKYIFLDRDGTLNIRPPQAQYIEKPEDFIWIDGAQDALKKLSEANYSVILVSNQPGIARGSLTEESLNNIHEKMQSDLSKYGTQISHIYYCPHNWDENCTCRKPKPGMFFQAQKDLSLNLTNCWMIGDDERDMHAGSDAGCKCIMVSEQHPLSEIVDYILKIEGEQP